ncbi:hypothetical protein DPMN_076438 [Dreissena polymorpha]|uniref:Uncharacterized protein n=1 Tax=Dreissena polymorpha TaxID=45954 RepID=A0A9D3YMC2_DREPO|nr:hypothetical protein DPMN_076438 [Dreissena polymorpha]
MSPVDLKSRGRHTTFSRRSIRRATNQSTVKIDCRLICRASRERRENVVCRPVWEYFFHLQARCYRSHQPKPELLFAGLHAVSLILSTPG